MNYLETAFGQLSFAWKLYNYGQKGKIDLEELDEELTFQSNSMVFVVPKAINDPNDLQIALENNLTITFGAAAITLNRVREEIGIGLPNPINTEEEQCVAMIYQIRNAFAHDIAEPRWKLNDRYRRQYQFAGMKFNLVDKDGCPFRYEDLGGPDAFFRIREFFSRVFKVN